MTELRASQRLRLIRWTGWGLFVIAVGFGIIDRAVNAIRDHTLARNFAPVRAGVLYRSGQMQPAHFCQVLAREKIRTVVQLNPERANAWEEEAARAVGADLVRVPMPGTGLGRPEDFERVLSLIVDPARQPVLVHCAAGSNRTGMVTALFRMRVENWSRDDAVKEMMARGFDGRVDLPHHLKYVHGWLGDRRPYSIRLSDGRIEGQGR